MSDLAPDNDGSISTAADAINAKLTGDPARRAVPMTEPDPLTALDKPERPRGPDGKFLPTKQPDGEVPLAEEPKVEGSEAEVPAEELAEETAKDAPKGEDAPKAPKVKVKVDGIEQEVDLDEAAKGYSRTADYTRKTQALAEERKRFETEELAPTREERRVYAERLAVVEDLIQALLPSQEPDWAALRQSADPETFQKMWTEWDANRRRYEGIRAERQRVQEAEERDANTHRAKTLQAEHEKLVAAIPEFGDEAKGAALRNDLVAYAKSDRYKFTDDDLAGVTDHRVLVLLNKARLYDEAQLRKPKIEAKVDRALDTMKPSPTKPKPKPSDIEQARARLKSSGRVEDAAALINLKLGIR
jgi:hypothetical protein